ncbi:norbelladine synthase-like [Macadamia integrifolia]|uniref:norbelladine synthase-like n=1 Tax=Macadamia integrifolia TaxID=60698 RepID=UPI001C4ECDE8|nr:norbelladine synthase-like [Macadamia integrifolia]
MHGEVSNDVEVVVPAAMVWDIYGTPLKLAKVSTELLSDVVEKIEILKGDGGVGTLMKATFPPGSGFDYTIEKYKILDHEKHLKVAEIIEGGPLKLGFSLYRVRNEIIEKDVNSTIIRSSIEYEINEEFAANVSFASTALLDLLANAIGKYLAEKKADD